MAPGTGRGVDFQVVTDAAAAGDSVSNGTFTWFNIAGTWFWIDPVEDLAFVGMVQHQNLGTTQPMHALSRSVVYQAVVEYRPSGRAASRGYSLASKCSAIRSHSADRSPAVTGCFARSYQYAALPRSPSLRWR
jgi:CubicO group peptidase (beta-lactamase class C family)